MSQQRAFPNPVQQQQMSSVVLIKAFLFTSLILFTFATVAVEVAIILAEAGDFKYNYGVPKAVAVGYFIGAWFGMTIWILMAYLIADIAESYRLKRR